MLNGTLPMEKNKKRERNVNFSIEETEKLVSLVESYKNIIENKKSDAVTWQEKKKAWKDIEEEFNSSGVGTFRDAKHIKLKYEALKRDTRKKYSIARAGGGLTEANPLTPIEHRVIQMMLLSVEGGESIYDSDQLDVMETDASNEFYSTPETNSQTINLVRTLPNHENTEYTKTQNSPQKRPLQVHTDNPAPSMSSQVEIGDLETSSKKWCSHVRSKKHPALYKVRRKRPFDKLIDKKLEIVELEKQLVEEELQEKIFKKQMMENELQYKKELYELEKEERLLKIQILKWDLGNKNNL